MTGEYVPSPEQWVRDQVELYERSGGTEGTTLRDTGLAVIVVTHIGNKTGAIRKTPLMRVADGDGYVLIGSRGGAPTDPVWVHNLRANPAVTIRDETSTQEMRAHEVKEDPERARLWDLAVAAFPPTPTIRTRPSAGFRYFEPTLTERPRPTTPRTPYTTCAKHSMAHEFDLAALRDAVALGRIRWQLHALERMLERSIPRDEVVGAILKGQVIEPYLTDRPLPSCLLLHLGQQPLHVVAAVDVEAGIGYVITTYRPDLEHFEADYKTRRRT